MRTSEAILALAVTAGLALGGLAVGGLALPSSVSAESPRAAKVMDGLEAGLAHFRRGEYEAAVPLLDSYAQGGEFAAIYALAQIHSDTGGTQTDHAKAFVLFNRIAEEYYDVDPDDPRRAPFVARALTRLAAYLRVGLPEIAIEPDMARAAELLHHAALFFGYEDAQFELVKIKLRGEGVPADVASAKHWLAVLTQRGHASAQAFLADIYFRGGIMERDPVRALALAAVSLENAPPRDRIWIEDAYQRIYCGSAETVRKQGRTLVVEWRTRYGRKPPVSVRQGLTAIDLSPDRVCQNGEPVVPLAGAQLMPVPAGEARAVETRDDASPPTDGRALETRATVPIETRAVTAAPSPATDTPTIGSLRTVDTPATR
jgi:hypothetical protein